MGVFLLLLLLLLLCFLFVFVLLLFSEILLSFWTLPVHYIFCDCDPVTRSWENLKKTKSYVLWFWMWVFWALVVLLLCQYALLFTHLKVLSFSIQNHLPFISDCFFIQSMTASTHICLPGPCLSVCGSVCLPVCLSVCLSVIASLYALGHYQMFSFAHQYYYSHKRCSCVMISILPIV